MINLLPLEMKEQVRFAKLNRLAVGYLWLTIAVVIVIGGIFGGSFYLLQLQTKTVAGDVADKEATLTALNKSFVPKAKDASDRLAAVKFVQGSQTRFSAVIADFAKVLPQGVTIDSLTLTGDDTKPVRIAVTASSYEAALAFRNALTTSPRVAAADLETIASTDGALFTTSVVVGFKPGQAK